jgi:LysM repeat protein
MVRSILAIFLAMGVVAVPGMVSAEHGEQATNARIEEYTVAPGDTLGSIALRFNVGVAEVRDWNNLDGIEVRPGDRLVVKSEQKEQKKRREPMPVVHVIRRGDTLEDVARKYGVSLKKVLRWNRKLNPRRLQIGQEVRLYIPGRDGRSVSWGSVHRGRLYNGVAMQSGPGVRVRKETRAYGTRRTVQMLEAAMADVAARWQDAPSLVVGDISSKRGGHLRPHRSHQSGRDADLSYYHRGNVKTRDFLEMTRETFDAAKNWHLFKTLLDTGQVEFIFVDYPLQKQLYEYALSIGYTPDQLEPLIQYPNGRNGKTGIIRHARGHDDHFHIRFTCPPNDKHCR